MSAMFVRYAIAAGDTMSAIRSTMAGMGDAGGHVCGAFAYGLFNIDGHMSYHWDLNSLVYGDWDMDGLNYWVGFGYWYPVDIVFMVGHWDRYGLIDEDTVCFLVLLPLALTEPLHEAAAPCCGQGYAHR